MREDRRGRVTRRSSSGARRDHSERDRRERVRIFEDTDEMFGADTEERAPVLREEERGYGGRADRDYGEDRGYRDDRNGDRRYRDERNYRGDDRRDRAYRDHYESEDGREDRRDRGRRDRGCRDEDRRGRSCRDRREEPRRQTRGTRRVCGGDTERFVHQIVPYVMFWMALFGAVSLVMRDVVGLDGTTGALGSWFAGFLHGILGSGAYVLPLFLVVISLRWKHFVREGILALKLLLSSAFVLLLSGIVHVFGDGIGRKTLEIAGDDLYRAGVNTGWAGGFFGGFVGEYMGYMLRLWGTCLIAIPLLIVIGIYLVGLTPGGLWQRLSVKMKQAADRRRERELSRYDGAEERHLRSRKKEGGSAVPALSAGDSYDFGGEEDFSDTRKRRGGDVRPTVAPLQEVLEGDVIDIPDDDYDAVAAPAAPSASAEPVAPATPVPPVTPVKAPDPAVQTLEEILRQLEEDRKARVSEAMGGSRSPSTVAASTTPSEATASRTEADGRTGGGYSPFSVSFAAPAFREKQDKSPVNGHIVVQPTESVSSTTPVTSTVPVAPTVPVEPVVPVAPSTPVAPVMPVEPEVPVVPTPPAASVSFAPSATTAEPVTLTGGFAFDDGEDTAPADDFMPEIPVASTPLATPVAPAVPVEPTEPVTPVVPVEPTAPVAPATPVAPTVPVAPVVPVRREPVKADPVPAPETPPAPREYQRPPITLLNEDTSVKANDHAQEINDKIFILRETLESFNIRLKDEVLCSRGPTITRYELRPEIGVSVRSVINRIDDISLALAAPVRIEAPIPGKPAIGIEVPNAVRETVYMRTMLESDAFKNAEGPLEVPLGVDVGGQIRMCNLAKMPHLLVAGSTGSGKSVCINTILISLMYKVGPEDLRLILIDPKQVEFTSYAHVPHLYAPIVTEATRAVGVLACAVQEMERRYSLISDVGVRNIEAYNKAVQNDPDREHLPYMVIVIDEFADLKMACPNNDVEMYTSRLAQKARAAGMHLIIGTQRPTVNVITGNLKTNIISRISFKVTQQNDSRTILDENGAESLTGRGDMLYKTTGLDKPLRIQGAFVSDSEVESVADYIRKRNDTVRYNQAFMDQIEVEMARAANAGRQEDGYDDVEDGECEEDPKFREAVELAIQTQKVATSLLQRRLGVGYGRAAKIIDRMEELGYVTPSEGGNKPRKVLVTYADLERLDGGGGASDGGDDFDE